MTQKINEFKNWLFEKTKKSDNIYSDSSKKKKKQKKNAIRNETGEITSKKYKGLWENIMNNYIPTHWKTWMKW